MFDCDEFKLRQDDFVDALTNTTCKRKLLFEFLRLLGREVKKSLHKCPRIEISADMGKDSSWCLTGCGTDKKKKNIFTNYELYLRVIEFFVKRLKKCVITRARSTLCNTTLSCTYILALPLSETLTVGGIPILITLYVSAGVAVADPECNTGFVQTGLNPPSDGGSEVAEPVDDGEVEPVTDPVTENGTGNGAEKEAAASTKAIQNGNGSNGTNGSKAKSINGNGKNGNGKNGNGKNGSVNGNGKNGSVNGKNTNGNGKNGNEIEDVENSEDEPVEKSESEIESPEISHDENGEDETVENKPTDRNGKNGNGDKPKSTNGNGENGKNGKNGKNKDKIEDIGKIEDEQDENKPTGSNGKNGNGHHNGKNGKNGSGKVKDEKKPSKDNEELIPENHGEPEKH